MTHCYWECLFTKCKENNTIVYRYSHYIYTYNYIIYTIYMIYNIRIYIYYLVLLFSYLLQSIISCDLRAIGYNNHFCSELFVGDPADSPSYHFRDPGVTTDGPMQHSECRSLRDWAVTGAMDIQTSKENFRLECEG